MFAVALVNQHRACQFSETAVYPDGEEVSSARAYARYGKHSAPIFRKLGD